MRRQRQRDAQRTFTVRLPSLPVTRTRTSRSGKTLCLRSLAMSSAPPKGAMASTIQSRSPTSNPAAAVLTFPGRASPPRLPRRRPKAERPGAGRSHRIRIEEAELLQHGRGHDEPFEILDEELLMQRRLAHQPHDFPENLRHLPCPAVGWRRLEDCFGRARQLGAATLGIGGLCLLILHSFAMPPCVGCVRE